MTESYKTVEKISKGEIVEKRSRFICTLAPARSEEQALAFLSDIKAKYWDAKHNVYAYILRDGLRKRYSDDSEPKGTAGLPVLDVLSKNNVVDVIAVVTRYFGGVLLGTGGLVRAYSSVTKEALSSANLLCMSYCKKCSVKLDYSMYGVVKSLILGKGAFIEDTIYSNKVEIIFHIKKDDFSAFERELNNVTSADYDLEALGEDFMPCSDTLPEV